MEKPVCNPGFCSKRRLPTVPGACSIPIRGWLVENPIFLPRIWVTLPSSRPRRHLDPVTADRTPQVPQQPPHLFPSPHRPKPSAPSPDRTSIHSVHSTDDDDEYINSTMTRFHRAEHCGSPLARRAHLLPDCALITKEGS